MNPIRVMLLAAVLGSFLTAGSVGAAEEKASSVPAEPLFSRHVVPLLSKLGCNAGACHGMVQGKGGLRLSLFGVDPVADHERFLKEESGRRLNRTAPDASLLLLKATAQVSHEGGKRTSAGSPEYQILRNWIAAGAVLDPVGKSIIRQMTVTPGNRTVKPGEEFSLRVQAVYMDDTREDVTPLCVFEVSNREVAEVDVHGKVRAVGVGDTALVVRYPGQVALSTLIVTPEKPASDFPAMKEHNFIDKHVLARLRLINVQPSEVCDDATFLRRVTLDVTGALPDPQEIRAFLFDTGADKRAKKIDELLQRPGYSALWATKFMDTLRVTGFVPATFPAAVQDEYRAYEWLRARFKENVPYDELTERVLLATSREGRTLEAWADETIAGAKEETEGKLASSYASRRTLDLFWQRRMATDVDHAIRVGHSFLGLRLQCAQCHRHPHDVWTQDDLLSFANFFMRVPHFNGMGNPRAKAPDELVAFRKKKGADVPGKAKQAFEKSFGEREIYVLSMQDLGGAGMKGGRSFFNTSKDGFATVTSPLGTQSSKKLRLLGESEPVAAPSSGSDPRTLVMAWLRRADNPYFAKALVNRVWAHYFDRGIIDPPDDLSPLNPPSNPELLQELCTGFIQNKFDLKWLHRAILNSRTYQQSSETTASNRNDRRNFASFYVRRVPAEVLLDIIDQSTGSAGRDRNDRSVRGSMPSGLRMLEGGAIFCRGDGASTFALTTFGRPERDVEVVCDCERDNQATMLQALFLANHPAMRLKVADKQGRVAAIMQKVAKEEDRIVEVFLATLSRMPNETEMKLGQDYVKKSASPQKGLEGLMWGLLNSNGFLFNQ